MRTLFATAAILLAVACSSSTQSATVAIDTLPGGAERVLNSGPSEWQDTSGWKLVLDHTIQPAAGQPGELGNPMWVAVHPDGSVLVSDYTVVQVALYDPTGTFVRLIGRDGDGPGEFRRAEVGWLGDTIVVHDNSGRGRGTLFLRDGTVVRSFETVCCAGGAGVLAADSSRIRVTGFGADGPFWVWITSGGARVDSMMVPKVDNPKSWQIQGGVYSIPYARRMVAESMRDGNRLLGASDLYQIALTERNSDTVLVFGRSDVGPLPIPDSLRNAVWEQYSKRPGFPSTASKSDIPTHYGLFNALHEDGKGNIWVGTADGFDVFGRDGIFVGTVAAPWTGPVQAFWNGDMVAVRGVDEKDEPRIGVYRIER